MANAQLCKQRVNGAQLHTGAATAVAKLHGIHMILAVGHDQRQRAESLDDLRRGAGSGESLQQFLQYQAGGHDGLATRQRRMQRVYVRSSGVAIATQRQ